MGGCGGCGMGGGFLVGGWMVGFVVTVSSVVAGGAKNSWVEQERDRGERDRERGRIKNNKERIFKWSVKKNKSFDVGYIVKWRVICYKVGFLDANC